MPKGIGYANQNVTADQHAARKGCIETLMEDGLSREEAVKRCGGLKPVDLTPRKKGSVTVDLNERRHYFPKFGR